MIETALGLMAAACLQAQDVVPVNQSPTTVKDPRGVVPGDAAERPANLPTDEASKATSERLDLREKGHRWFVRVGGLRAFYNSGARITTNGEVISGSTVRVNNSTTLVFDVGYDMSDDVSIMFMGGIPPTADVIGEGTISSFGKLGSVRIGPAVLTAVYRLPEWHGLRPYVGAGGVHLFILKNNDAAVQNLKVHDNWGFVLQAGVEYRLNDRWELFADYKRLWLDVDAKGSLGGAPILAGVTLDPDALSAGVKFRFR